MAIPKGIRYSVTDEARRPAVVLMGDTALVPLMGPLSRDFDLVTLSARMAAVARLTDLPAEDLASLETPEMAERGCNAAGLLMADVARLMDGGGMAGRLVDLVGPEYRAVLDAEPLGVWLPGRVLDFAMRQCRLVLALDALRERQGVAAVLVHNDVEWETACAVNWAGARGAPSLHVPHAIYHDAWRAGRDVHDTARSGWLAVAGPFQKKWYLDRGVDEGRVRMTGLPQWDGLARHRRDREGARALLRLDPSRPVVTFASSWEQTTSLLGMEETTGYESSRDAFAAFLEASREGSWQAVVKLHPRTEAWQVEAHRKLAESSGVPAALTMAHRTQCLDAADALFAVGPSNIIIEAALMGVPGLAAFGGFGDDAAVETCGPRAPDGLPGGLDPGEVGAAVRRALAGKADGRAAFVEKYAGPVDGKAAERVVGWVRELAGVAA